MAEEDNQQAAPAAASALGKKEKPTLFIILAVINMLIVAGVGIMLHLDTKAKEEKTTIDDVVQGEKEVMDKEAKEEEQFIGKLIPMETFLVNLADTGGGKLMKINMSLEVAQGEVQEEIEKRKPQIRDIILILLSAKTHGQVSTTDGKNLLRDEIKNTVNSFLTKGKVNRVLFTEFYFN